MCKITTAVLIGAVAFFGGFFVLSGSEDSDIMINKGDISNVTSVPPIDVSAPAQVETATFAMGCFWSPDALFGSTPGVVRTRVGYAGGTEENPTYREIGGHTETVQIEYDPTQISYGELLNIFWKNHNAEYPQFLQQYKSIIFYHDMKQRLIANETVEAEELDTLFNESVGLSTPGESKAAPPATPAGEVTVKPKVKKDTSAPRLVPKRSPAGPG